MANAYKHKRTSVAGRVPTAAQLEVGQIAINLADKKLYTKNESNQVVMVGCESYSKTEADARYVPQGILPITRVGSLDTAALPITFSTSAFTFTVTSTIPVLLSGRYLQISTGTVNLNTADGGALTNPANKTVYLYVELVNSVAVFRMYTTAQLETFTRVYIGSMVTNGTGVTSNTVSKVSRIDVYRPSLTAAGSAFPVSSGTPNASSTPGW